MTARSRVKPVAPATISESDGVRYLHLDSVWIQGAMRIADPKALELEYIQRMMAWMLLRPSDALTTACCHWAWRCGHHPLLPASRI